VHRPPRVARGRLKGKTVNINDMFESRFIRPSDLDGKDWTLTIANVRRETLPSRYGAERLRPIMAFAGARKELVLNRTNVTCLAAMWGEESDAWVGKRVTLHPVDYEGKLAIRVRGSPDLAGPVDVRLILPKKRPFTMRMQVTRPAPSLADAQRRQRDADGHRDEAPERHGRLGPHGRSPATTPPPGPAAPAVPNRGKRTLSVARTSPASHPAPETPPTGPAPQVAPVPHATDGGASSTSDRR
jgi:hypothetical protein